MHVEYHKVATGWFWLVVANGQGFAMSCKYYKRRSDCVRAFQKLDRLF